ncbi:hypothetical protein [Algisphaera agarilytica]|uniref:Uncharacterized protein n=1 Tax=Algisphaera agarilytica TaxID=1385975 RepID=A0A7X0H4D5_9BACT|nr:hypothetical protein [Algisphaera agarilytica]MBB6429083.1 hypothetical protein [Algisphaera agarilytica]
MNRIQTACYCLIASALVLSGLLVVQLSERVEPNSAEAALVIARENFTLMTAEVRSGEEALFVLDNTSGTLLVYRLEISRKSLQPAGGVRLDQIFSGGVDDSEDDDDRRRR